MTETDIRHTLRQGFDTCISKAANLPPAPSAIRFQAVCAALRLYADIMRRDEACLLYCQRHSIPYLRIIDEEYEKALSKVKTIK